MKPEIEVTRKNSMLVHEPVWRVEDKGQSDDDIKTMSRHYKDGTPIPVKNSAKIKHKDCSNDKVAMKVYEACTELKEDEEEDDYTRNGIDPRDPRETPEPKDVYI